MVREMLSPKPWVLWLAPGVFLFKRGYYATEERFFKKDHLKKHQN
jgi:hypothetical protein